MQNGNKTLTKWLQDNSYSLLAALVYIIFIAAITTYRIDALEKNITKHIEDSDYEHSGLSARIERNRVELERLNRETAKDLARITVLLEQIRDDQMRTKDRLDRMDANIADFYRSYQLTPRKEGNP